MRRVRRGGGGISTYSSRKDLLLEVKEKKRSPVSIADRSAAGTLRSAPRPVWLKFGGSMNWADTVFWSWPYLFVATSLYTPLWMWVGLTSCRQPWYSLSVDSWILVRM